MRRFIKQVVEVLDGTPPPTQRGQRGQSLVEMTLIMPILLIILLGVIEMGWYAQNILTLTEAARVGARRAPFLNGNFSPLAWNEAATYPPPDTALDTDPRVRVRGGIAPDTDCNEVEPNDNGFFNLIVCATISSMDPLVLNQTNDKDDIVVSAFALQRVTIGATSNDDVDPAALSSSTAYDNGTQLIVVGRYPYSANECYLWAERDPFDWITNGTVDFIINPVQLPFEIAVWDPVESEYVGFADDNANERMVGFSWLGQWRYVDDSGARTDCYGSQWKVEQIEERANLDGFLTNENDRQYLPSVGMVLVEVFWEHTLIFEDFPAMSAEWSPVYQILGGSDPDTVADVIRTWAMFPAPGAEPRLVFK